MDNRGEKGKGMKGGSAASLRGFVPEVKTPPEAENQWSSDRRQARVTTRICGAYQRQKL